MKDQIDSLTSYFCGRKNSCANKIKYTSTSSAIKACKAMEIKRIADKKKFEYYHCWFCGSFHIGGALNLTFYKFLRIFYFWIKKPIQNKLRIF